MDQDRVMRPARQTRYALAHDLDDWKTDPRIAERGFAHRWDSIVEDGNGEDFFLELLDRHLRPGLDVLDVGCGHGPLALKLAGTVRSVVGVERNAGYLSLAGELLAESGLANVRFVRAELDERHGGSLPLPDQSVDLVVDRRGPTLDRFIDDLRRVARPGAVIVGMHPAGTAPRPSWAVSMPSLASRFASMDYAEVAGWVTAPLTRHGISDFRLWWIDVPEYLCSARALYDRLRDDQATPWPTGTAEIEAAFAAGQHDGAVVLRHIRLVWTARLP
jgi:SAM-dependent methyltransferase